MINKGLSNKHQAALEENKEKLNIMASLSLKPYYNKSKESNTKN